MEHLKSVIFALLTIILILLDGLSWSHGCVDQEREALLQLKPFFNYLHWPVKAEEPSSDCCEWKMVECNSTTRRITKLSLQYGAIDLLWYLNTSYFLPFEQLTSLNLSGNTIGGFVENQGWSRLRKLEVLDLTMNEFNNITISSLSGLSSLKHLNLTGNLLSGTINTQDLSNLVNLKRLDMSGNHEITGFSSLKGFENLRRLRNLEFLDLSFNEFNNSILSSLRGLSSLKDLDLSLNQLSGIINTQDLNNLLNLKKLDMSLNGITSFGSFKDLNNLLNLKKLDMSRNRITSFGSFKGLCELQNLEELDLSYNEFGGTLPPCLANLSSIRILDLSHNQFIGNITSSPIPNLKSIESLSLGYNHFQVSLKPFANHSSLKSFTVDGNELIDVAPSQHWTPKFQLESLSLSNCIVENSNANFLINFLHHQFNLRSLDLSSIKFGGAFLTWLFENNTRLEQIYLANNSFEGQFQWPSHPNPSISLLDISHNKLEGHIPSNISLIFPNLIILNISKNFFQGTIPPSFGYIKSLIFLDFSNNQLYGEVKDQFSNTPLKLIKLSDNNFSGCIPSLFDHLSLELLFLDGNNFVGEIPDHSSYISSMVSLDISRNSLSGRLPRWVANMPYLQELVLSDNHFEGSIPLEFCKLHDLRLMDLSRNYLSGSIPPCFNELTHLEQVLLSKNKLRGPIPHAFHNFTGLRILDLGGNNFSGTIPNWIGNLWSLTALLLQANNFHGDIPIELCRLKQLNILVLSSNNLSGHLPGCISNLSSITPKSLSPEEFEGMTYNISTNDRYSFFYLPIQEALELTTKSNTLSYTGYILEHMYEIDLSCNKFSGEIPIEFGYSSTVRSLNLSHNNLTGLIPSTFSKLNQLESLDLSYNDLNGGIPPQLIELNSLEVFNVAHNNLSGPLPDFKAQFGTFDASCYEGNPLLCGPPLNNSCNETDDASPATPPFMAQSEDNSFMDMIDFWVSFTVTYAMILFSMTIILFINPYWRQKWFYHIEVWINTCYYFVVDKFQ